MVSSSPGVPPDSGHPSSPLATGVTGDLQGIIEELLKDRLAHRPGGLEGVLTRLRLEVERVCSHSDRIQDSGNIRHWQRNLIQHRLDKCLTYYDLGSTQGRMELHATLSAMVYRPIVLEGSDLNFQGRYVLIEDFLQTFYIEALNNFRREHQLPPTYTPRTRLELAEFMAFSEQYAKRTINLPNGRHQQLIVLRAQTFARRQPAETSIDLALVDAPKPETGENTAVIKQVREKITLTGADTPEDAAMRDRVITALVDYFKAQQQSDCLDYLTLKLEDCSTSEIEVILNLSPRQRDYLQQRFRYHVDRFSRQYEWELVHEWLGAKLEDNFGMTPDQWATFLATLPQDQGRLIQIKQNNPVQEQEEMARLLGWTPKKVDRIWTQLLKQAWQYRNQKSENRED
jgi:hypothetical protein